MDWTRTSECKDKDNDDDGDKNKSVKLQRPACRPDSGGSNGN